MVTPASVQVPGVFSADEGEINIFDNSISLLALGVGFHKKLSGRENILLAGMLFGFTDDEVREKMDEIIAFADLGEFIDKPVSTYSSGMYSKLSFAITAILETDIMLVDEVFVCSLSSLKNLNLLKTGFLESSSILSSSTSFVLYCWAIRFKSSAIIYMLDFSTSVL